MNSKDYANIAGAISKVIVSQKEADKASKMDVDEIKVVRKATVKNFYKNPDFYKLVGGLLVAGATGQYVDVIGIVQSLFGMFN